jgi:hypothetical protein
MFLVPVCRRKEEIGTTGHSPILEGNKLSNIIDILDEMWNAFSV